MHDAGVQALLCLLVVVALLAWCAGWKGRGLFDRWQARREAKMARSFANAQAMERMRSEARLRPGFLQWEE